MKPIVSRVDAAEDAVRALYECARQSRDNAHSPYSGVRVGAAVRLSDGRIFGGCNVENASYGATICAERAAIGSAVSQAGPMRLSHVMVVTDARPPWPPCGLCRQVIAEFGVDCVVFCANLQGEMWQAPFGELFPGAFGPEHLQG